MPEFALLVLEVQAKKRLQTRRESVILLVVKSLWLDYLYNDNKSKNANTNKTNLRQQKEVDIRLSIPQKYSEDCYVNISLFFPNVQIEKTAFESMNIQKLTSQLPRDPVSEEPWQP